MEQASRLDGWESFYVIVGSSAAALTGLQFVIMTLIADDERMKGDLPEVGAFSTPTVVHFCAALLIAVVLCAPWPDLAGPRWALIALGAGGIVFVANIIRNSRRLTQYKPVLEDWIGYFAVPMSSYIALFTAALVLPHHPGPSLFVIGGVSVLLVLIGIRNAWDTVTFVAQDRARKRGSQ